MNQATATSEAVQHYMALRDEAVQQAMAEIIEELTVELAKYGQPTIDRVTRILDDQGDTLA
jgi:hypothetical protein